MKPDHSPARVKRMRQHQLVAVLRLNQSQVQAFIQTITKRQDASTP
ncbi:MAG: hypothetical protein U0350_17040 [Caldilineaceae bacterium]